MKIFQDLVCRTVIIAALVGAGIWYAQDPDFRPWPFSCFQASATGTGLPNVIINQIDWSADGRKLMLQVRGESDAYARLSLHDAAGAMGSLPIDIPSETLSTSALAPDGRHLVAAPYDGRLWWIPSDSAEAPVELIKLRAPTVFSAIAVASDGLMIAAGTTQGSIYLCQPSHGTGHLLATGHASAICDLHFSRDGSMLLTTHNDGRVTLWEVGAGELIQDFRGDGRRIAGADFLWDGARILTVAEHDSVRILEIGGGRELWSREFGLPGVITLAVSPDGKTAAWAGYNRRIIVWDLEKGEKRFEIACHVPAVFHLKFSPDGSKLVAAAWESVLRMYDSRTGGQTNAIDAVCPEVF